MCLLPRRGIHDDIGENGRQPIDPTAASWSGTVFSLAALRANGSPGNRSEAMPPVANDAEAEPARTGRSERTRRTAG
jgi:hypothetical protein